MRNEKLHTHSSRFRKRHLAPNKRGPGVLLEIGGASMSLRLGRLETFFRRRASYDPRWACIREAGSLEVCGFGLALTVSVVPMRRAEVAA